MRTPALFPRRKPAIAASVPNGAEPRREIPRRDTANRARGSRSNLIVRPGTRVPMVTDDYRGLPKGRVRPGYGKTRLPEREQENHARMSQPPAMVYPASPAYSIAQLRSNHELIERHSFVQGSKRPRFPEDMGRP